MWEIFEIFPFRRNILGHFLDERKRFRETNLKGVLIDLRAQMLPKKLPNDLVDRVRNTFERLHQAVTVKNS
jgi:hypothetical protein